MQILSELHSFFSPVARALAKTLSLGFTISLSLCNAETSMPQSIDFNRDIRPIFISHCTACHGGVKQAGDLSFVYADSAMNVIDPGDPDCYLMQRIIDTDDESRMPPPEHGPRLPQYEVDLLTQWIEEGAQWGGHWAYVNPRHHDAPKVSTPDWVRQPMDAFVLAKLDELEIKPSKDETPTRWLRRVSLDLIGLPPTAAEQRSFLAQHSSAPEAAASKVVDRLLASPHFGEHWASVWLDQVRYADSRGYGEDSFRTVWKYRDWVINAFNQDMPYDQFSIHQLAGDLLPDANIQSRVATAVHRLTHTNEEGGTDDEEFRVTAVLDRVNTTWQTWMGTTFGCVQCHSHPYDPFGHDEYYRFAAYFNSTADCDFSDDWPNLDVPVDPMDYEVANQLDDQIRALKYQTWKQEHDLTSDAQQWQALRIANVKSEKATKVVVDPKEDWDEYHTVGTVSNHSHVTVDLKIPELKGSVTGIRISALPLDPKKALADAEVGFVMSHISARGVDKDGKEHPIPLVLVCGDEPFPIYDPAESLNDESRLGFAAFSRVHHRRDVVVIPETPADLSGMKSLRLTIKHKVWDLASFILMTRRAHFALSTDPELAELTTNEPLVASRKRLNELQDQRAKIESSPTPILRERIDSLTRPTHRFIGGLFLTKGEEVTPGVPVSLHKVNPTDELPDRLAMAKWVVGKDNPLTARVAVNRLWARLFGQGLVTTEEDFGSSGTAPSHPDLLDDLAVRFRDDYRWSVKQLLREIVLSSTYRQKSKARTDLDPPDASNQWLARGPRHSLPAETVRDQMLAISGLLSDKMYGPPVEPPLPPGVWKARRGTWKTPGVGHPDRYRRSIYTKIKRSVPFPIFAAFDAPSRDFCVPKRLRSNTPLQPLMLLNDRGFVECAESFADLMQKRSEDLKEQIDYGISRATCRQAESSEIERLVKLHGQLAEDSNAEVALNQVAAVILNLDEIITK